MEPQVTGALIAAAGTLLGGGLAIAHGWWSRRHEARRTETEWFREKLLVAYSECLYYLVKLGISAVKASVEDREVRQHYSEAQRYLLLLRAYHTGEKEVEQLRKCRQGLIEQWDKTCELANAADQAKDIVTELLERDARVRVSDA